jgi:hypothetical protein
MPTVEWEGIRSPEDIHVSGVRPELQSSGAQQHRLATLVPKLSSLLLTNTGWNFELV